MTTADVASESIKDDLANANVTDKEIVTKFVTDRLVKQTTDFHDSLKKHKLKTLSNLYSGDAQSDKYKTKKAKAERDMFRHIIVLMVSERNVDIDQLLQQELSSIPLALATTD